MTQPYVNVYNNGTKNFLGAWRFDTEAEAFTEASRSVRVNPENKHPGVALMAELEKNPRLLETFGSKPKRRL